MNWLKVILPYIAFTVLNSQAQSADTLSMISVQGNRFVDAKGQTMIFRGIALSDPDKLLKNGQWNVHYFNQAKAWGANIVRIPVHPQAWRKQGVKKYLGLLDLGVQWAKQNGLYVIIDWHVIGNLKTGLMQDPMYDTDLKETMQFWRTIASHYTRESAVAFYEIFNEPTVYNGQLGEMSWKEWKTIAESIIKLIYAFDKNKIPLVGGLDWAYDLSPIKTDPIALTGVAYVTHPYPQKRPQPWETHWQADWGFAAAQYPVFATEFGFEAGGPIPTDGTTEYGRRLIDFMKQRKISWTVWCFDPNWGPCLIQDWNFTPTEQGEFFKRVLLEN